MRALIFLMSLVVSSVAYGSQCSQLYPNGKPIEVTRASELCNSFFVTAYDTQNRAVLFSSERLVKNSPVGTIPRVDSFRSDGRVKMSPANSNYKVALKEKKYDRGHMAPADDASTPTEMRDTFLLTNMTPQEPTLNRISWKQLEEKIRTAFKTSQTDMYVLTIAVYDVVPKKMNNIPIPSGYWKVVYFNNKQMFFYAPNTPHAAVVRKDPVDVRSLIK